MRQRFESEPGLQLTPIEQVRIPLKSRDELPPILAGLQWIWCHPTLKGEILELLERAIMAGEEGTGGEGGGRGGGLGVGGGGGGVGGGLGGSGGQGGGWWVEGGRRGGGGRR